MKGISATYISWKTETAAHLLKIEIGDFSLLADGQKYYDASAEFAAEIQTYY